MQTFKFLVICLAFTFVLQSSYAQQIQFNHITTDDGLSQNSVISIAQDSSGFLWFATQDGLNKYDGSNFLQHEVFFRDITQDTSNQLGKITVDIKGRVWMTTLDGGLQFCDPITEDFTYVRGIKEASYIHQDKISDFWVSSFTNGLYHLKEDEDQFSIDNYLPDLSISKIVRYQDKLLLATQNGITKFDPSSLDWENLFFDIKDISDIEIYNDDQLLISTLGNGLYLSKDLKTVEPFLEVSNNLLIQDLFIDSDNKIWIATYGDGVYYISGDREDHFTLIQQDETSISYNDVLTIFQDQEGNMWFGTDGGGVSYIVSGRKPIYSLTNNKLPNKIPVDVPRSISKDEDGNLWVGTSGNGLTMLPSNVEDAKHYSNNSLDQNNLSSDRIMSLFHDSKQDLWIGTQEGGLMLKQSGSENFKAISLPCKTIWDIEEADEDHLWLCTRNEGLILLDKRDFTWSKLSNINGLEE